jgi:hypothetical protein
VVAPGRIGDARGAHADQLLAGLQRDAAVEGRRRGVDHDRVARPSRLLDLVERRERRAGAPVAAGGRAGAFSCFIPGWSSAKSSAAITKEIRR